MVTGDSVILLHGIFLSSRQMRPLAAHLGKEGYEVHNLDYPSTRYGIEALTERIQEEIARRVDKNNRVHYVGFSMGGLLVRALLNRYRPEKFGRAVQLAPPNGGSEVADFWKDLWLYRKLYGPAGQQLITDQSGFAQMLGEVNYELGVVAGNRSIDPMGSWLIKGKSDGKVSVEKTKVPGMKDHLVVKASHTFFPYDKQVQRQTAHFLRHGVFAR